VWAVIMSNTTTSTVIAVTFLFSKQARCEGEFGKADIFYVQCTLPQEKGKKM
jgi:hypothetical protein